MTEPARSCRRCFSGPAVWVGLSRTVGDLGPAGWGMGGAVAGWVGSGSGWGCPNGQWFARVTRLSGVGR
jgi:hypothetical protein